MTDQGEESELRAAVQFAVIQICAEEEMRTKTKITPQAINALSELTYLYASTSLRNDLDAFSSHAGRKTIHEADVKLVARKNPDNLLDKLNQYAQEHFSSLKTVTSKTQKKEIIVNLDNVSSSSSDDDILKLPSKKTGNKPLAPASDSSFSSAEDDSFRLPTRPARKQKLFLREDDSSESGPDNQNSTGMANVQPLYSSGGSRIKDIIDQLSQDSFERKDVDMQE